MTFVNRLNSICIVVTVCVAQVVTAGDEPNVRLLICGGGAMPERVYAKFREMSGERPQLVVIPTASDRRPDVAAISTLWKSRGFDAVSVLHATGRNLTEEDVAFKALTNADAVWFGGGSQQRIADAYLGTAVECELYRLKRRGVVIGGTSAGAAIQSRTMISGGKKTAVISTGFDLLPGAIIDQHFLKRNRVARLMGAIRMKPQLTGFGIDEGTALAVRDGVAHVIGRSFVLQVRMQDNKTEIEVFEEGDKILLPDVSETAGAEE